jgi:hypothetical protein
MVVDFGTIRTVALRSSFSGRRYLLGRKLGAGAFGDIYLGTSIETGNNVAVKMEMRRSKHLQLFYEVRVYRYLVGGGAWCGFMYTHFITHDRQLASRGRTGMGSRVIIMYS